MRKSLLLLALCAMLVSGCSTLGFMLNGGGLTGHAANPSAAPDQPAVAETTAGGATSTREARIKAGLAWLWQCVARLREMGVASGPLDELAGFAGDMERLAGEGKAAAAVEIFGKAWALAAKLGAGQS
jgi:hypothetical protein